jgi:two-component system, OmpR family, sensor histidine kinase MtrB
MVARRVSSILWSAVVSLKRNGDADKERSPGPSLRTLSLASALVVGVLSLSVIIGLVVSTVLLTRSTHEVERAARGLYLAADLDRSLRDHHRLANLWAADRDRQHHEARRASIADLRRMIADAAIQSDSVREARLVASFSDDVETYIGKRREIEARVSGLDGVVIFVRPHLERALDSVDRLESYQEDRMHRDYGLVDVLNRATLVVVILSGTLLLGTLVAVVWGVNQLVLVPLAQVRRAMQHFEDGDAEARADESGSREICEIARTFNEMADTIGRRRQDLLTFLAGVAHDLKNPISALKLGYQGIMSLPAPIEPRQLKRLTRLNRQLDRLTRMVDDLFDAVRVEAGELGLEPMQMDLRTSVRDMVELYGPTSPAHTMSLELPDASVDLRADPLRIEQVISNLLSNAIKYSPRGGPVNIRVLIVGEEAELVVSDQGIGIADEDLPNIFVPFRRGSGSKEVSAGAGLGLSVVHRIVTAHGGSIAVESTPGSGSTFRVRLPLVPRGGTDAVA